MTDQAGEHDDDPNGEPALMTRIDGEEARLLVHIELVDDAHERPVTEEQAEHPRPPKSPSIDE